MDIINYTKIKTFKLFGKLELMTTVEQYSESIKNGIAELQPIVVEVASDYFKEEFEVEDDDTEQD